jgi:SpoVK/Ycf46/Vps4 family AAA+-type ATPase
VDTPEEKAILRKIYDAIITKACGFRTFAGISKFRRLQPAGHSSFLQLSVCPNTGSNEIADYAGSKEFQAFFRQIAVDRYKYQQFKEAHKDPESILLFGPPGTGKTLLVEALAAELADTKVGTAFLSVSSADIKGRYVGESEQTLKMLFRVARELTKGPAGAYGERPVVIFIDEIDGLIGEASSVGGVDLLGTFNAQVISESRLLLTTDRFREWPTCPTLA